MPFANVIKVRARTGKIPKENSVGRIYLIKNIISFIFNEDYKIFDLIINTDL